MPSVQDYLSTGQSRDVWIAVRMLLVQEVGMLKNLCGTSVLVYAGYACTQFLTKRVYEDRVPV